MAITSTTSRLPQATHQDILEGLKTVVNRSSEFSAYNVTSEIRKKYWVVHEDVKRVVHAQMRNDSNFNRVDGGKFIRYVPATPSTAPVASGNTATQTTGGLGAPTTNAGVATPKIPTAIATPITVAPTPLPFCPTNAIPVKLGMNGKYTVPRKAVAELLGCIPIKNQSIYIFKDTSGTIKITDHLSNVPVGHVKFSALLVDKSGNVRFRNSKLAHTTVYLGTVEKKLYGRIATIIVPQPVATHTGC